MRIAIAQINLCVGDISKNADKIMSIIEDSRSKSRDLVIFPELALCGYPPEDLLFRNDFYKQIEQARRRVIAECKNTSVLLGYPRNDSGKIYNS